MSNDARFTRLSIAIEDYEASSICNDEFECRYITFGSKPCDGHGLILFTQLQLIL